MNYANVIPHVEFTKLKWRNSRAKIPWKISSMFRHTCSNMRDVSEVGHKTSAARTFNLCQICVSSTMLNASWHQTYSLRKVISQDTSSIRFGLVLVLDYKRKKSTQIHKVYLVVGSQRFKQICVHLCDVFAQARIAEPYCRCSWCCCSCCSREMFFCCFGCCVFTITSNYYLWIGIMLE